MTAKHRETIAAYAVTCREAAAQARARRDALQDNVEADGLAPTMVQTLLGECRRACDYAERVSAFAARVEAGRVDAETMATAAEAIAAMGAR